MIAPASPGHQTGGERRLGSRCPAKQEFARRLCPGCPGASPPGGGRVRRQARSPGSSTDRPLRSIARLPAVRVRRQLRAAPAGAELSAPGCSSGDRRTAAEQRAAPAPLPARSSGEAELRGAVLRGSGPAAAAASRPNARRLLPPAGGHARANAPVCWANASRKRVGEERQGGLHPAPPRQPAARPPGPVAAPHTATAGATAEAPGKGAQEPPPAQVPPRCFRQRTPRLSAAPGAPGDGGRAAPAQGAAGSPEPTPQRPALGLGRGTVRRLRAGGRCPPEMLVRPLLHLPAPALPLPRSRTRRCGDPAGPAAAAGGGNWGVSAPPHGRDGGHGESWPGGRESNGRKHRGRTLGCERPASARRGGCARRLSRAGCPGTELYTPRRLKRRPEPGSPGAGAAFASVWSRGGGSAHTEGGALHRDSPCREPRRGCGRGQRPAVGPGVPISPGCSIACRGGDTCCCSPSRAVGMASASPRPWTKAGTSRLQHPATQRSAKGNQPGGARTRAEPGTGTAGRDETLAALTAPALLPRAARSSAAAADTRARQSTRRTDGPCAPDGRNVVEAAGRRWGRWLHQQHQLPPGSAVTAAGTSPKSDRTWELCRQLRVTQPPASATKPALMTGSS